MDVSCWNFVNPARRRCNHTDKCQRGGAVAFILCTTAAIAWASYKVNNKRAASFAIPDVPVENMLSKKDFSTYVRRVATHALLLCVCEGYEIDIDTVFLRSLLAIVTDTSDDGSLDTDALLFLLDRMHDESASRQGSQENQHKCCHAEIQHCIIHFSSIT